MIVASGGPFDPYTTTWGTTQSASQRIYATGYDIDSDLDGVPDLIDSSPTLNDYADSDGDGISNSMDLDPYSSQYLHDADGDYEVDAYDEEPNIAYSSSDTDSDGDGFYDMSDSSPTDPYEY